MGGRWGGRRLLAACVVLGVAAASVALGPPATAQPSSLDLRISLVHASLLRQALLHVPATAPAAGPVPLVLVLHGLSNTPRSAAHDTGFGAVADHGDVALLYPQGWRGSWDAGQCCGDSAAAGVDDVGFLVDLVSVVATLRPVDRARVYIAGFSNGGMMALRAACEHAEVFRAVASVDGTLEAPCRPPRPFSALLVNGDKDRTVPFAGDPYSRQLGTALTPVLEAAGTVAHADACAPVAMSRAPGERDYDWTACREGTAVRVLRLAGLAHQWPTVPSQGVDGWRVVWSFLDRARAS